MEDKKVPKKPVPSRPIINKKPEIADAESQIQNVASQNEPEQTTPEKAQVKPTKEKQAGVKNNQKTKSKKFKIIIILCAVVMAIVAGVVITVVVLNGNKKTTTLDTPVLEVVQLYNGTILKVDAVDGATNYEFILVNASGNESKVLTSTNVVELKSYLNQAGTYSVKARALGNNAISEYCEEITFSNNVQLESPKVFVNGITEDNGVYKTTQALAGDDTISWDAVSGATGYRVQYGVDLENSQVKYYEFASSDDVVIFNLSNIYANGTGVYAITVVAISANGYYLPSDYVEMFTIEYTAQQTEPQDATYNSQTQILTFKIAVGSNFGNEFDLYIDSVKYKIYMDDCQVAETGGYVVVTASLKHIVDDTPTQIKIATLGDGDFATDSVQVDVTIQ